VFLSHLVAPHIGRVGWERVKISSEHITYKLPVSREGGRRRWVMYFPSVTEGNNNKFSGA
jgi:hypothetical protein